MAKLRVITDTIPMNQTTSGVVLQAILEKLASSHDFEFYILENKKRDILMMSEAFKSSKFHFLEAPISHWGLGFLSRVYSGFIRKFFDEDIESLIRWIKRENSRDLPDHQIFVLQSSTSILLCEHFKKTTPTYSTITWDSWSWWSRNHKVPYDLDVYIQEVLDEIYADGFHLVPNQMWAQVFKKSSSQFYPVYVPFNQAVGQDIVKKDQLDSFNFCFSGKAYALFELEIFVKFMESKKWMLFEKKVYLHFFGPACPFKSENIIYHGNIPQDELIESLSRYDIAILPYPSGEANKDVSQLSFPSKYLSYLAAGLPTVFIGDTSATVCSFVNQAGFSIDPWDLEKSFDSEFFDLWLSINDYKKKTNSLLAENFSALEFSKSIERWLASAGLSFDNSQSVIDYQERLYSDVELNTNSISSSSVTFTSKIYRIFKIFWLLRFLFMRKDKGFDHKAKIISIIHRLMQHVYFRIVASVVKIRRVLNIFLRLRFLFIRNDGGFHRKTKIVSIIYRLMRHRYIRKLVNTFTKLLIRIYQIRKI